MAKKFVDIPSVKKIFLTAERVLGYDLQSLCLRGPRDVLDQTVYCQPAVVVASLVALESLKRDQPQVRGPPTNHTHSFGTIVIIGVVSHSS